MQKARIAQNRLLFGLFIGHFLYLGNPLLELRSTMEKLQIRIGFDLPAPRRVDAE